MKFSDAATALRMTAMLPVVAQASPFTQPDSSVLARDSLSKRDVFNIACGQYSTADYGDTVNENLLNLDRDGNANVSPASCSRAGCYNTSGFYICNDQDVDLEVPWHDVVALGRLIESYCGNDDIGPFTRLSGQIFTTNNGGYNVVIAYGNCQDPGDMPPSAYTPPGPNGDPLVVCGFDGQPPCESAAGCPSDALTVETSESIVCNEYLGPTYIGAGATYTYSTTRSIGTTWNVGGFLGINIGNLAAPAGAAGVTFSFSETTTTGDISGISADCGNVDGDNGLSGNWTCGMDIAPKCVHLTGTCATGDPVVGTVPYDVVIPQVEDADGQSIYTAEICTCPNCSGFEEGGAPNNACGLDCKTCLPSN